MTNNLLHNLDRLQHDQQTENQRLRNKVATLQTENTKLTEQLGHMKGLIDLANKTREHWVNEAEQLQQRIAALEAERDDLVKEVESLKHMMRQDGWTIDE